MRRLGTTDLEILRLGIGCGGTFDERDMQGAPIASIGTGRMLDALASLRDRGLIRQEAGGFAVTDAARGMLWDAGVPLWARILRLLQVRSCTLEEMASYLQEPGERVSGEAESMRKAGQVMASPQRRDGRLLKVYEIQEAGTSRIDAADGGGLDAAAGIEAALTREPPDVEGALRLVRSLRGSL